LPGVLADQHTIERDATQVATVIFMKLLAGGFKIAAGGHQAAHTPRTVFGLDLIMG